ncbi:MAG: gliding motility-associated C-terminal domain-containing protein [Saprospiraceae bacterium]|nr:gliding motility-associated C-terminal domain-containing protein [Saprospiraceae bacterium]
MDRPVQIVLLLAAIFSLRLNFFQTSVANSGNTQPANRANKLLASEDDCIEASSTIVNPGIQIIDFQANRTTFGFTDEAYTQPFDPSLANKKVALPCDSVEISLVAIVNGISVSDSLGFQLNYGNPDGSNSNNQLFQFSTGDVRIVNGGNSFNCSVPNGAVNVTSVAGQKSVKLDLNNCLIGPSISLSNGDSIFFKGRFLVNANGPVPPQFTAVPGFTAFGFAKQNGSLLSCDTLSENFFLGRSEVVFDFPNTLNGLPIGCEQGELDWRLFVPNNDFSDWFGAELRPAAKVDSLVFDFDPGLLSAFTGGVVEVSIPGHPLHGSSYYPIRPLSDFPNGHYVAMFDTLTKVPSLNEVQTYSFDLRVKLTPTCKSPTGSNTGDNIYDIASAISFTDRFYASFIGDGSCANAKVTNANSAVAYNQPPSFSLTALTGASATVSNNLASWDVRICNTSTQSDAGLNWLALEDPSGLLNIGAIANITNPGPPSLVNLTPYGGQNYFAYIPTLQAGDCLTFRIAVTTTSCDDVALNIRTGWNCGSNPPSWNPDQNAPCSSDYLPLTAVNPGVPPIQIAFTESLSACGATGESVSIKGHLTSASSLPSDNYTLSFIYDENGDNIVQTTEAVLSQLNLTGPITASTPLIFSQLLQVQPDTACHLMLKVESLLNSACNSLSSSIPLPQLQNAGTDRTFCTASGVFTTTLGGLVCDTTNYKMVWTALPPANNGMLSDTSVFNPVLSFNVNANLGQTLSFVLSTERRSCGAISLDTVSIFVPSDANGVFAQAETALQVPDCQSNAQFCAPISALLLPNFLFFDNGQTYQGVTSNCAGGTAFSFAPGVHEFVAEDTLAGCSDTILVQVNCTSNDTLQITLLLGQKDTVCFGSAELSGPITGLTNACQDGQYVDYQILNDSCVVLLGNLVGQETACMVVCDANGFCDTTVLEINVEHLYPNGILDTITLTQNNSFCFDANQLNLAGNIVSIQNLCPSAIGSPVDFTLDSVGFCLNYVGNTVGLGSACIELCDNLGNCDTLNFAVNVVPGAVFLDTVFLLLETDPFCLPQGWLSGPVTSITNLCPGNAADNVNFSVQGSCVFYSGFEIGTDTACYRFEDAFGNVALVELQISVRKTNPQTICDTLFVGQSKLHCLDLTELPGRFKDGTIQEICPNERTGNVEMSLNAAGSCVFYSGTTEGRDSSCLIYCDEFGFCDTVNFCFLVKPYFDPPILQPDLDTTIKGTPIVIDFLANDTVFGGIEEIYTLELPGDLKSGTVTLNLDNSFTYIPDDTYCARTDSFHYVVCNPNGCDTSVVSIYIQCIELTIFTAVSPNNDDVNDVFYIAKIEEFPTNHLWVYNIWGSLVFESEAYRNNWPGTWGTDTDLPDGTYYYILEWTDNGVKTVQKGYIEMFR